MDLTMHKQKYIEYKGNSAEVDEGIADLILSCWKVGANIYLSCDNDVLKNWIGLMFQTSADAEIFLNAAAGEFNEEEDDSLYTRIRQAWSRVGRSNKNNWKYSIVLDDFSVTQTESEDEGFVEETAEKHRDFVFSVSVRFPKKDLKQVMVNLQKRIDQLKIK